MNIKCGEQGYITILRRHFTWEKGRPSLMGCFAGYFLPSNNYILTSVIVGVNMRRYIVP